MRLSVLIRLGILVALGGCAKGVLNAPPTATITLSASPTTIPETGGESTIRAIVRLPDGSLVPDGVVVDFFTTLGTIDAQSKTVSGIASATLRSNGTTGTASVSALSGGTDVASVSVVFGTSLDRVEVTFDPPGLPEGGGTASVTVRLLDAGGQPLTSRSVTLAATTPATLGSAGNPLITDSRGEVRDTVTTTATTTVTATVVGSTTSGQGTLAVATAPAQAIVLIASPPSLPAAGGNTQVTAFVTAATSAPVPGVVVTFETNLGSVIPGTATTDASGRARTTLTTTETAQVSAKVGTLAGSVSVPVGTLSTSYVIALGAARVSVTDRTLAGGNSCAASANAQLPIEVVARVSDASGRPQAGFTVTVRIEDDTTDAFDGYGGFCDTGVAAGCGDLSAGAGCAPLGTCPNPPPSTPTPTPSPPPCCAATGLSKATSASTGSDGQARFSFTFQDTDLCACVFNVAGSRPGPVPTPRPKCTARIVATAPLAASTNDVVITFSP